MSTDAHTTAQLIASAKQLYDRGDFEAARRAYEQVLSAQPRMSPHAHSDRAATLYWHGMTLLELGDHTGAEAALVEARNIEATFATAPIQRARERAPEIAVDVVLNALRRHGDERGYGYSVYYNSTAALLALGAERGRAALLRALPLLHYTNSDQLHFFAETLLDLVFNDGQHQGRSRSLSWHKQTKRCTISFYGGKNYVQPERNAATITDVQREVLAAIVAHNPLWEWDSNLLTLYGLPAEREVLLAWLEN